MKRVGEVARLLCGALRCGAAAGFLATAQARVAHANDVADEVTLGRIAQKGATTTGYWSDRLDGSIDLSDEVALDAVAGVTHYASTPGERTGDIFQLGLGGVWQPSEHIVLDANLFLSPQSASVSRGVQLTAAKKSAVRDKTSTFGFSLGGEYDTAGDTDAESAIGLSVGATSYQTTQATRPRPSAKQPQPMFGAPEQSALVQWRAIASFTETLYEDTDLGVSGTYYFYSRDPTQSGYYGATVFGRGAIDDGIPIEPLDYSIRPTVAHRFGLLRLSGYFQGGHYHSGEGSSYIGGTRFQYKFSRAVRAWLAGGLQVDSYSTGGDVRILWASAGARIVF
jgi:hypothetical protein